MRRSLLAATAAGLLLGAATPAHAGTYTVSACGEFGKNESWSGAGATGVTLHPSCTSESDPMFVQIDPKGSAVPAGMVGSLNFGVPAGLSIADWEFQRTWSLYGTAPADKFNRPFLMYVFDGEPYAGGGHYFMGLRDKLKADSAWESPDEGDINIPNKRIRKIDYKTSARFGGGGSLSIRVGCVGDKPCKPGEGGLARNAIHRASVTIQDDAAPSLSVAATGLLAPGPHNGNDPITVTAADPSGIRSIEVLDQSVPDAQWTPIKTNATQDLQTADDGCSATLVHACADVSNEAIPAQLYTVGTYPVSVRAVDHAGNVTAAGPYTVDVTEAAEPLDPGAPNGDNVTDGSALVAGFGRKKLKPARSIGYGKRPTVSGRLVNNAGVGISNATLSISTKDKFRSFYEQRGTIRTGPDGGFTLRLRTPASRTVLIGWRPTANAQKAAARVALELRVRATAKVRRPRGVRHGRTFRVRGQVQGADPRKGVRVRVQALRGKRWRVVGSGRAGKTGRFKVPARIGRRGSARVRVQVRGRSDWPYEPGSTPAFRLRVR